MPRSCEIDSGRLLERSHRCDSRENLNGFATIYRYRDIALMNDYRIKKGWVGFDGMLQRC
jgi:hypothetical protein